MKVERKIWPALVLWTVLFVPQILQHIHFFEHSFQHEPSAQGIHIQQETCSIHQFTFQISSALQLVVLANPIVCTGQIEYVCIVPQLITRYACQENTRAPPVV